MINDAPLLEISDLDVSLGSGSSRVEILRGLDLQIGHGETVGIVGESGCGKSTLGRAVCRLVRPSGGSIRFQDHELVGRRGRQLKQARSGIQLVGQDPSSTINPRLSISRVVEEPLIGPEWTSADARHRRIAEVMEMVGLGAELLEKRSPTLSGGQRQRVAIARALAARPELVVLDEPTSSLDVSVQARILSLLQKIQTSTGISFLFISHDLPLVFHLARRIAVMYLGQIVEAGHTMDVVSHPAHPYTATLLTATPQANDRGEIVKGEPPDFTSPPSGCRFHPRCPIARSECRVEQPRLESKRSDHADRCLYSGEISQIIEPTWLSSSH